MNSLIYFFLLNVENIVKMLGNTIVITIFVVLTMSYIGSNTY